MAQYPDSFYNENSRVSQEFPEPPESDLTQLLPWQRKAAQSVKKKLLSSTQQDHRLGLICQPPGTGKSLVLGELCRLLLQDPNAWSVLILSSTTDMANQYKKRMDRFFQAADFVVLADSVQVLKTSTAMPGSVILSTAQKLLVRNVGIPALSAEPISPYSLTDRLLVIVEEAAYNYFSRTYQDMHLRFPNAYFLGITSDPEPSSRLEKYFGPILYDYSFAQAFWDGQFQSVRYEYIHMAEHENMLWSRSDSSALAKRILSQEKSTERCALLLCDNPPLAEMHFSHLLTLLGPEKVRFRFAARSMANRREQTVPPPRDCLWDGTYFHGVVVACTLPAKPCIFDAVYLDKKLSRLEFISLLAALAEKNDLRKETGILYDLCNGIERLSRWAPKDLLLPTDNPSAPDLPDENRDKINTCLLKLSVAVKQYQYGTVRSLLDQLHGLSPEDGKRLFTQLTFLFPPQPEARQKRYWDQHRTTLAWQSDLWCLLSRDSRHRCRLSPEPENADPEAAVSETSEPEETKAVPEAINSGTAQEKKALLEQAAKQLIQELFSLDSDACLEQLRIQDSGLQFGFDVTFTYRDSGGAPCTCVIECKNYHNRVIQMEDIAGKLASLQNNERIVDHWILLSPHCTVSNELNQILEKWRDNDFWAPIGDIQVWTPNEHVHELFGLVPHLYAQFYNTESEDPQSWSEEKRKAIAAAWKKKITPVLRMPPDWKTYLRTPRCLLTQREADRNTIREYEFLYHHRAPIRLLDESELPTQGLAEQSVLHWLRESDRDCALLLGDFGDGKSFFTYTLARRMTEEFLRSPGSGWIPLRLSLRGLGDHPVDSRTFLDQRLLEFCAGVRTWNEITQRYRFLVILDGLDEMSLGMNDTAVLHNLNLLEQLLEQFQGHRILVTSRKKVIYADKVHERLLTVLQQPEVWHLAPLSRTDRLAFLDRLANTKEQKARLIKIQQTHDLMGLAAKPLFLDMLRVQLDNDHIHELDMSGFYRTYAEQVLARKQHFQLALAGDHTSPGEIRRRMLILLEEMALCMQRMETDSLSLEEFKTQIDQDNLASFLWDSADSGKAETVPEDADARISNRSLLKYDCERPENRSFCHRSMKEYFTANGLVRYLHEAPAQARTLLMDCSLGYEILEFAGNAIHHLNEPLRNQVIQLLVRFAQESRSSHSQTEQSTSSSLAHLSTNSVNLLYYSGAGLPGQDWSHLVLDHVILSGLDISGKDFSFSSMRYAHLDNADMTACDLRGCDFTGVQFEKSGQLISFAADARESSLLALYKDGKLRRWDTASAKTETLLELPQAMNARLLLNDYGCEGLSTQDRFSFWQRGPHNIRLLGEILLPEGLRLLDFTKEALLQQQNKTLYLLTIPEGRVLFQRPLPDTFRACLLTKQSLLLWTRQNGLELIDTSAAEPHCTGISCPPHVNALCAAAISDTEGTIAVSFENSRLQFLSIARDAISGTWQAASSDLSADCGDTITGLSLDECGSLYVGTASGQILQYSSAPSAAPTQRQRYRLELRCAGARIEGVKPEVQYEALRKAVYSGTPL